METARRTTLKEMDLPYICVLLVCWLINHIKILLKIQTVSLDFPSNLVSTLHSSLKMHKPLSIGAPILSKNVNFACMILPDVITGLIWYQGSVYSFKRDSPYLWWPCDLSFCTNVRPNFWLAYNKCYEPISVICWAMNHVMLTLWHSL